MNRRTVVTGVGLALPGVESAVEAFAARRSPEAQPVDPAARIGKKGLRYKDRATQLALCAADSALRRAGLLAGEGRAAELTVPAGAVGVVVSSNHGNLDTVCEVTQAIAEDRSSRLISPMATPNLSSNVIASEVAIRFGLRGPNLMVCNGATSGLDAVHWAMTLIAAGRAEHMVVVGAEPDNPVVRRLTGHDRLLDGAAALVLERQPTATARTADVLATLAGYLRTGRLEDCLTELTRSHGRPAEWYVPEGTPSRAEGRADAEREERQASGGGPPGRRLGESAGATSVGIGSERPEASEDDADSTAPPIADGLLAGVARHDLAAVWGIASGALGVLQCAVATERLAAGGAGPVHALCGSDADDATAGLVLLPGRDG